MNPKTDGPLHLGIVLYPGFEPLDVFGPLEMFMNVGVERLVVHMIAQEAGLVPSSTGAYPAAIAPKVQADVSLADAPPLDIIMVPGGFGTLQQLQNETLLVWLRERAPSTRYMTSVCSGSAILAKAGLLDGRKATSNKQLDSWVESLVGVPALDGRGIAALVGLLGIAALVAVRRLPAQAGGMLAFCRNRLSGSYFALI